MSLIPKSFRFTEIESNRINEIRLKLAMNKDIDVVRKGIDMLYNSMIDQQVLTPLKPLVVHNALLCSADVVHPVTTSTKIEYFDPENPYDGWKIIEKGMNETEGFEYKVIQHPKIFSKKFVLKRGDDYYDKF